MSSTTTIASPTKHSRMSKQTAYWAVTGLLALDLVGSGLGALTRQDFLVVIMQRLGFPLYSMGILGIAYIFAAVALLVPKVPLVVKEWAYAGVVFAMIGAFASHALSGDAFVEYVGSLIVMSLTIASYWLRPASLRLAPLIPAETI